MEDKSKSIYQFHARLISGKDQDLSDYKGKVVLIVNIASACGLNPQLKELQQLKNEFTDQDFEILGFPSNDFGGQEPLEGTAINDFCEVNYGVKFPIFGKSVVKGPEATLLYKFLGSKNLNGRFSSRPKWNFHKYLIDKDGRVVDYFYPFTKPLSPRIKKKIQQLL
jgi:glutathione peroxidase